MLNLMSSKIIYQTARTEMGLLLLFNVLDSQMDQTHLAWSTFEDIWEYKTSVQKVAVTGNLQNRSQH